METSIKQTGPINIDGGYSLDIPKLFQRILRWWWIFVIGIGLGLAAYTFFIRYATNVYSSRAVLLIKDAGKSGNLSEQAVLLSESVGGQKSMDNEIQILKSLTLMEKVVDRLNLEISYFRIGTVKESELYKLTPIEISSYAFKDDRRAFAAFLIDLDDYESFILKENEEDEGTQYYFGVPFTTDLGTFTIDRSSRNAIIKGPHRITIVPKSGKANVLRNMLAVERIGDQNSSSVLQLSLADEVAEKTSDIINTLIDEYNKAEISDQNQILRNTLDFIDNRVYSLTYELDSVEREIQNYKSRNEIISNSASNSMEYTLDEIRRSLQDLSDLEVQQSILASLNSFLETDSDQFDLIPANLIAENPVLTNLVNEYNTQAMRHRQLAATASELNPSRIQMEEEIGQIRNLILQTIQNLQKDLQIPISKIERNIESLRRSMSSIPRLEKQLVEQMRNQKIKENLYNYLLQKREETALSEAVATAKTRVIDRARVPSFPIYPKKKMIRAIAILLGILLPFLGILIYTFFDNKITSIDDVKRITSIPILGKIPKTKEKDAIVVTTGKRTLISEMFKMVRTNLNYSGKKDETQVLLITSSISGEGKTFTTLNLAASFALSGKRTVVVETDLRRPKFKKYLNDQDKKGIVHYLVGETNADSVIYPTSISDNLHYIPCGTIPPNPSELLLKPEMQNLVEQLKTKYDLILIDTPPISLVADGLQLRHLIHKMIIIVKENHTKTGMVRQLEEMYQEGELNNVSLIYNYLDQSKSFFNYSYKNSYEYYTDG